LQRRLISSGTLKVKRLERYIFRKNVSVEILTTGRLITLRTNSPPAVVVIYTCCYLISCFQPSPGR